MRKYDKLQKLCGLLLKRLLKKEDQNEFAGDLDEVYESMKDDGSRFRAAAWYLWRIIESIPAIITYNFCWSAAMFGNYIKIAIRNIKKHKLFSLINVFGLSIGMSCCLITLIIVDNMVSDKTHERSDDLYRVIRESSAGIEKRRSTGTPLILADAIKRDYKDVLKTVRLISTGKTSVSCGDYRFKEHGIYYTEPSFFEMFTIRFISGDPETALSSPSSVVINEEIAKKYFKHSDPLGKTLTISGISDLIVTGVFENVPEGSNFDLRMLLPMSNHPSMQLSDSWQNYSTETFILLSKNSSHDVLNPILTDWIRNYTDNEDIYTLQPFNEIRLYGLEGSGEIYIVYIFTALSVLVLLIGCINFMNLSTAKSGSRSLEIGLRKVIGAKKKDVIIQSLGESIVFAFLSLLVSFLLVYLTLPQINKMGDVSLALSIDPDKTIILGCIAITLITGILSGSYPAFYISSFQPVRIIKGISRVYPGVSRLRKLLVVVQFTFTLTFIILTIVLHRQLSYMKTADMGFNRDNIVILDLDEEMRKKYTHIRSDILGSPLVENVAGSDCYPYGPIGGYLGVDWEGKKPDDERVFYGFVTSPEFFETFGLRAAAGQDHSSIPPNDHTKFILNQAAIRMLGFRNPIGRRFSLKDKTGEIIGVVEDFNYRTIDNLIEPLFIKLGPFDRLDHLIIKYRSGSSEAAVLSHLDKIWNHYAPELPFEYEFLDEKINRINGEADAWLIVSKFISFQAVFISCMGLFALTMFAAEQKKQEIGIRKVLGSSVTAIVSLLSRDFIKWVAFSVILAWPAAWLISGKFLQLLPYHKNLEMLTFIIPGIGVLVLGYLTVGYQVIKAANADPVNSIRHE